MGAVWLGLHDRQEELGQERLAGVHERQTSQSERYQLLSGQDMQGGMLPMQEVSWD